MGRYNRQHDNSGSGLWVGIVILCIGLFFFVDKLNVDLPRWIFSWPMLLILIGVVMGAKHKFQGPGWIILILVGGVFLVNDIVHFDWNIRRFMWPAIMIVVGIYLIGKASTRKQQYDEYLAEPGVTNDDYLQSTAVFSSTNKVVLSKNFKGGNVTTVFGGTELNFMQADINGEAVLDITTLFGGVEIVVPANWDVKMDVNTVFGGIEDKRMIQAMHNSGKILIIKGSCTFGGVDLKSF